jgi:pimeloyl-ACP methyl ester carboxylesterase
LRERDNLSAAIGYYRTDEAELSTSSSSAPYAAEQAALTAIGPQPTLYLHGEVDGCIDHALIGDVNRHLAPGSTTKVIEGAGHFLHVENPIEVNRHILAWLTA